MASAEDRAEENFLDLCRLCIDSYLLTCTEKELILIYGKEGNDQKISEKINKHLSINVKQKKKIPT